MAFHTNAVFIVVLDDGSIHTFRRKYNAEAYVHRAMTTGRTVERYERHSLDKTDEGAGISLTDSYDPLDVYTAEQAKVDAGA